MRRRVLGSSVLALAVAFTAVGCSTSTSNGTEGGGVRRHGGGAPTHATGSRVTRPVTTQSHTGLSEHVTHSPGTARPIALVAAEALRVVRAGSMTGYDRDAFGPAWSDDNGDPFGHNGCDTRDDVLRRDLLHVVIEPGTNGCVVETGVLDDPYTGRAMDFVRGPESARVQIDHVVPLGDAWQTGARGWSEAKRQDLGNDPLNLLAVDGSENESKGDADAASWLPPNHAFWCAYVARQVAVKRKYGLGVTRAEKAEIVTVLKSCPGQGLLTEPGAPGHVAVHGPTIPASQSPTTHPAGSGGGSGSGGVYYANCTAARAAGAAPLYRGQPGYRPALDRDGDGVACED